MKNIIDRIVEGGAKIARYLPKAVSTRLAVAALAALAAGGAWASIEMTNPVTGQKETYVNTFTGGTDGTDTEWNDSSNWDTSVTPFVSGDYNASLVDGKTASTSTAIDGYTLRVGAYNGAAVTWSGGITKIQAGTAGCWLTADATSSITLAFNGNSKQLEGSSTYPLKLSSAKAGGITWTSGLANAGNTSLPFWYYLKGAGTVVYGGDITVANAQVIKMADVTLSGNAKSVQPKTLVSFGSGTTKTFTADAAIKVYGTDGTTLATTVNLATVNTTGSTTLTTSDPVGTVELVQTSTGVVLYYVDGDPADVNVGEKTYKPSISVNFTSGTALSTAGDVGLAGYAVPGTSWNNLTVENNATLSSLNKIDSTGAATASSASVTITNTRGYWTCSSLVATSDMRAGYIDETADVTTPTVTVSGIPYDQYKVVVYTATDAANVKFGYVTINGTNYTYSDGAVAEGTTAWGASGAKNTAEALAEGVNVLVSPVVSGGTLTVVGHRSGDNPRGCIAAVQIVKVEQTVGENDLLIELDGDRTYTFDEAKAYSGTVYVTGEGTVTFAGSDSTAATLHIGPAAAVNMNGSSLTPATVTGNGTVVYDGVQPSTTLGFDNSANWTGTVWVKNVGAYDATSKSDTNLGGVTSGAASANPVNNWGNAYSFVKFTNVKGYMYAAAIPWTLILEDDGAKYAWYNNNGWGSQTITIAGLKGDGTFYDEAPASGNVCNQPLNFTDGSAFLGTIYARGKRIGLGGATTAQNAANAVGQYGSICIPANGTATVSSGKTWSVYGGFIINGTLNDNGTLATLNSSAASIVSGSGTVVFTARLPTPADTSETSTWWKNANWTGTVWIKSHAIVELDTNLYGNEGSTLKFTGVTGYFAQNHVNTVPIELENSGSTVAFNYNNGWGGELLTFSELKGAGTLQTSSAGDGGTIWVKKWDAFTGVMNLGKKQVVMGGSEPAHGNVNRGGKLVIAEGAVVTNLNSTTSWTAGGGIEVNGTFAASDRTAWADGTAMTINSTGILNMYGSGVNDTSKSFANVTGTGTIWYSQTTTANDKWSALPSSAANMFANTLSVSNDNVNAGVIITMNGASDVVTTNANISGTGYFRSDWGTGANRGFLALQSKNTTWSGTFGSSSRIKKFIVAGVDGATDRTLTLAGTQSSTIPLTVESLGSVNITGTYLGATTVSGTFGGTGTLTGDLTFNAGATFKAFASDTDGLAVNGTVTCPAEGTVTVDVSALEQTGTKVLMTASGLDVSKFALASGQSGTLSVADGALKVSFVTYVAEYNGVQYETVQEAINAAEQAGGTYADVTILDATAECPEEYYIDTENGNVLTKCQAAIVKKNDAGKDYFKTGQLAFDAIATGSTYYGVYDYVEIYYGTGVEVSVNPAAIVWTYGSDPVRIKCYGEATVTVSLASTESTLTAGTADENGIVTYTKADVATTYVWAGGTTLKPWSGANNWKVGTLEGATATRKPGALDTVQIGDGAKVTDIVGSLSVAALQVSGTVTFTGGGSLTSASAITLGANDSIVITGTLSPVPTTTVADYYVKATTSGSTTTYAVVANPTVTITAAEPVFQDYTNATLRATIAADSGFDAANATYTATVGNQSYNGTYANGSVTFEIPGSAGASADVTITATHGGAAVSSTTAFVFGTATDWFEETATTFGDSGTWANADTTADKIVFSGDANATFTPTKKMTGNTADVVWVVSFDAPNDDDLSEELVDAQTAFRLATASGDAGYVFQLWAGNAWNNVAAAGITPATGVEYTVTNHFDYGTHTFTASVNGVPLAAKTDGTTSFALPSDTTKVNSFEFAGSGALTGIAGNFINTMLYQDADGNAYATLAEVPSGTPVTAINTNMILTVESGLNLTAPQGMTAANFKPTYQGTSISDYVDVLIKNGKVTLSATEAAKPSATAMTAGGIAVGNVKPGLYYWVEASTTQNFADKTVTVGKPEQATSEAAVTVKPTNPTGKVIFYRVAVDAETPAPATP